MPMLSLHPCAAAGCPTLVHARFCKAHAVVQERARPNCELRKLYRTTRWYRLRSVVLQQEPFCPECKDESGLYVATTDVHHTVKATPENFFDREILQALCAPHHSRHTQRGE